MDTMVLATQKWLNKTYGSVANYKQVPETGNTGWPTIYGLIRGVQHELGIALQDGSPAFGEATSAAFDAKVVPNLKKGYKSNFVYLIQGAFWAKGISPEEFTGTYSSYTESAIKSLQSDAGIPTTGVLDSQLAQALFDMSAFVLVSGGDGNVRQMQQYLNANYRQYTGILPTDGIYQRATNTALIYGVQVELGLGNIANGFWGPTTISTYNNSFHSGLSTKIIKLIQMALYVNMRESLTVSGDKNLTFSGILDSNTKYIIGLFQKFMELDPVTLNSPDSFTMYSLMLSSGSPNRTFWGADTAYQLSDDMVKDLKNYEINYVGRYLTGTFGNPKVGPVLDKSLTRSEAESIIKSGMNLVPIYQDNNPNLEYFSYSQGTLDASIALQTAANLGIPNASTLYFAIDMDMTDDEITAYAIPYFKGILAVIDGNKYTSYYLAGVYGTRNVSSRLYHELGVKFSYVSNMSTGYSGNLGYSQPLNWSFDQFFEDQTGVGSVPAIDRVAVSHLDEGVNHLVNPVKNGWIDGTTWAIVKKYISNGTLKVGYPEINILTNQFLSISISYETNYTLKSDNSLGVIPQFKINTDGKLSSSFSQYFSGKLGPLSATSLESSANSLVAGIQGGQMEVGFEAKANGKFEITLAISATHVEDVEGSILFHITMNTTPLSSYDGLTKSEQKALNQSLTNWQLVTNVTAVSVLGLVLIIFGPELLATMSASVAARLAVAALSGV